MEAGSTVPEEFVVLRGALTSIQDPRKARGKRYPLTEVLCLTVLALMAGARSLSAVSRFGETHPEVLHQLGLRRSPCVATLSLLLRRVAVQEVREALRRFVGQLGVQRAAGAAPFQVVAVDGKTQRGVREAGQQLHMLHFFATEGALALDGQALPGRFGKAGEVGAAKDWLERVAAQFPGLAILTGDALLAEQSLCAALVAGQRDYVFRLKKPECPLLGGRGTFH
jgi:hypothetical protein